tara:strand:+ start:634 stop:807 length:174 start_codon:yes stop_codon:yes gene_type:complete
MRKNKNTIVLCGGKKCCPELSVTDDGKVKIKDDYGNTVTMDKAQAKLIDKAIKDLEK